MTYIKPDPEMQEEQEDLIMSYLNADYLSTDSTPLSPPSSTSSSSDTTGSPEKHSVDDFMLDINTTDFLNNDGWATSADNLFNPCFHQQQPEADLLATFPFFLPQTTINTSVTTPINFIQPFPIMPNTTTTQATSNNSSSSSASTCSLSDSEQPKKKRGRKKREPVAQNLSPVQPSLLAPKPLAPRPNLDATSTVIKTEPSTTMTIDSQQQQQQNLAGPTTTTKSETTSNKNDQLPQSQEAQKQAQIQKRQERLIKNRAAALLSRKRKREHLTCLEEEKQILVQENEKLTNKVATLENRIQTLEKENLDLKRLQLTTNHPSSSTMINIGHNKRPLMSNNTPKASKTTGVVFMIILFSFALFTLPSRTADRLTVGGGSVMDTKKQFPLIGSSHHDIVDYSVEQYCQTNNNCNDNSEPDMVINTNTDLVLIDAVRPRDLQTWINHKLDTSSSSSSSSSNSDIQTWFAGTSNSGEQQQQQQQAASHVYLYSKEFSQIAPMNPSSNYHQFGTTNDLPILSLISPYNQTEMNSDHLQDDCDKSYLQIDVQVLRSTVIKSQLLPLQQCDSASALLDGMKKDLITHQHYLQQQQQQQQQRANVTPAIIVKREKRANKKLARVIA